MEKAQREDERRMNEVALKEMLRQQRLVNDIEAKHRQEELKEELIVSLKDGDVEKIENLVGSLDASIAHSPRSKKLNPKSVKLSVIRSPKRVDSQVSKMNRLNQTIMKANMSRNV